MKPLDKASLGKMTSSVGVIDIGSNSIRLVVFAGATRVPFSLFNERAICSLAEGLQKTGKLDAARVKHAILAIGRFVRLAHAMNVSRLHIFATSAVRDAENGPALIQRVYEMYGVRVDVLSGSEEARYTALGVMSCTPEASGVVADLGGGSLELAEINSKKSFEVGKTASLPLGVLRLADLPKNLGRTLKQHADLHFHAAPWLSKKKIKKLYLVGGAWRAVAKVMIQLIDHPLKIVDKFTLSADEIQKLLARVAEINCQQLENDFDISIRRATHLPSAISLIRFLLEKAQPEQIIFSIHGVREGYYFHHLPKKIRERNPFDDTLIALTNKRHRFAPQPDDLLAWLSPLFPNESPTLCRLRHTACAISDLYWEEHPDYRAQQAFIKTLSMALIGFSHHDRAMVALSILYRHQNSDHFPAARNVLPLLTEEEVHQCKTIGYALRLAHTISGGAPDVLIKSHLTLTAKELILTMPRSDHAYMLAAFDKLLERLANHLSVRLSVKRV